MSLPHGLRAPPDDRAIVAEPALSEAGNLLAANRRLLDREDIHILGRSLADLRRQARQTAVAVAREYLDSAGEPVPDFSSASLLLAGHQPELFHPGVWVKNFALNGLAHRHRVTPLHLVVDNDTAKTTTLRVPAWNKHNSAAVWPQLAQVPFDHWEGDIPFEERPVHDEALFASFAQRAGTLMTGWNFEPLLPEFWAEVRAQARRTALLGERFVAARRALERRWGCHNLEVPISLLCRTEPFAWFACHLLENVQEFHATYNAVVRDYRRRWGIRSRHHPVPDLAQEGDWLEVPLWAWTQGRHRRQRLFVQPTATAIQLRSGNEPWPTLTGRNPDNVVAQWQNLAQAGFKIRTRALTTTLFARLFLADSFMHGIGGGKYDELTDELLRDFYRIEPPAFLVLSATLLLPFARYPTNEEMCRQLARTVRDMHYNPQRHVQGINDATAFNLAEEKRAWIARACVSKQEHRQRFQVLRDLNSRLRGYLADREQALRQQLSQCRRQVQANQVLGRRDFAFCFYPEAILREFCTRFL